MCTTYGQLLLLIQLMWGKQNVHAMLQWNNFQANSLHRKFVQYVNYTHNPTYTYLAQYFGGFVLGLYLLKGETINLPKVSTS